MDTLTFNEQVLTVDYAYLLVLFAYEYPTSAVTSPSYDLYVPSAGERRGACTSQYLDGVEAI
jgi:hypothetical protein